MSNLQTTLQPLSAEQEQKALERGRKINFRLHQKAKQAKDAAEKLLVNDPNTVWVGPANIDIFGAVVYQWVDVTIAAVNGPTLSFSGSDWAISLIAGEGVGVGTIFVPASQIPTNGYARVVAAAGEEGGVEVLLFDNNNTLLAQATAVIEGLGLTVPLTCYGTYNVS